jgi:hypothetical protein
MEKEVEQNQRLMMMKKGIQVCKEERIDIVLANSKFFKQIGAQSRLSDYRAWMVDNKEEKMMNNVVFVVDTGSDFERDNVPKIQHPVEVVSLNIQIGEKEYLDGVDINKEEFYHKMAASNQLPKTSQPSPQHFYDVFKKYVDEGKTVISLSIAASLSGTYQSSSIAIEY